METAVVRWVFSLLTAALWSTEVYGFVVSTESAYIRWPQGTVYYYIPDGEYNYLEENVIVDAMQQLQADSGNCIRFREISIPPPPGLFFVAITRTGGLSGPTSLTCYSFPGLLANQNGRGQYLAMQGGVNGCLGNKRQAMRILAALVGLRSEHNKPNRDTYLQINVNNMNPVGLINQVFTPYDPNRVFHDNSTFDFNSITLLDPYTFSSNGQPVLTAKGSFNMMNVGRLSSVDCNMLKYIYSCTNVQCQDVYGNSALPSFTNPPLPLPPQPQPQSLTSSAPGDSTTTPLLRPDYRKR